MNILFIHQNFPGQFRHLASALVSRGHRVDCLLIRDDAASGSNGTIKHIYTVDRPSSPTIHPWLIDFESKTIRSEAVFRRALQLKNQGYKPDVVVAHPGWGESLFIKNVWPNIPLGLYCEFYYQQVGADIGFDPEFPVADPAEVCRLQLKNLNNDLNLKLMDRGITPTHWQASTYPVQSRERIEVIHDGIDTRFVKPNLEVKILLDNRRVLTKKDEIVTFVNRSLEPCRGFHTFMRAIPNILHRKPNAEILVVGNDDISYGKPSADGLSWRQKYLKEIRSLVGKEQLSRLHFLGNLDYENYLSLIQVSSVHVYLTYPFVLSWSMLEAMSAGCAVVGSKTAPVEEVIAHGENGFLVDFFDFNQLSEAVCELLDNHPLRVSLGISARQTIVENYDLEAVCLPSQLEWIQKLREFS